MRNSNKQADGYICLKNCFSNEKKNHLRSIRKKEYEKKLRVKSVVFRDVNIFIGTPNGVLQGLLWDI